MTQIFSFIFLPVDYIPNVSFRTALKASSSSSVKTRLLTKIKLPRLPSSVLKVHVAGFLPIIKAQVYTFQHH